MNISVKLTEQRKFFLFLFFAFFFQIQILGQVKLMPNN